MKRILSILVIIAVLAGVLPSALAKEASFTLMLYVDGSTLEERGGYFTQDLDELKAALPKDDRFNVVICTGGSGAWVNPAIKPDCVQYHTITKDGMSSTGVVSKESNLTGSELSSFLRYATSAYPASRYGLIFWGHGNASPIGFGRNSDGLGMGISAISKGLSDGLGDKKLEFLGMDACLLGSVDMALAASGHARYFLASEELSPSFGWSYAPLARALSEDPSLSGEDICRLIADSYVDGVMEKMSPFLPALTISAVDLGKMDALKQALIKFDRALFEKIGSAEGFAEVSKARSLAKYFGGTGDSKDMIDLYDFAAKIELKEARALEKALKSAVIYNRAENISASNGLSLYFPMQNQSVYARASQYLQSVCIPEHAALINGFYAKYSAGGAQINMRAEGDRLIIAPESLPYVRSVEAVAATRLPDGRLAALSFVPVELEGGVAVYGGEFTAAFVDGVPVYTDREKGGGNRLTAPVMWNGGYARFDLVSFGGALLFDGAAYKAGAELFGLRQGDSFEFLLPILDTASEQMYHKGAKVSFMGAFNAREQRLTGYERAFRVTDVYGGRWYSS